MGNLFGGSNDTSISDLLSQAQRNTTNAASADIKQKESVSGIDRITQGEINAKLDATVANGGYNYASFAAGQQEFNDAQTGTMPIFKSRSYLQAQTDFLGDSPGNAQTVLTDNSALMAGSSILTGR